MLPIMSTFFPFIGVDVRSQNQHLNLLFKAKQMNILGSRQQLAEKVALWCDFF